MRTLERDIDLILFIMNYCKLSTPSCTILGNTANLLGYLPSEAEALVNEYRGFSGANEFSAGFDVYSAEEWAAFSEETKASVRFDKLKAFRTQLIIRSMRESGRTVL